jgi:phosphotransacetylase
MQSTQDRTAKNVSSALSGARRRSILVQGQMRADLIVVFHVRQQHITKMPLAEHNNVVKTFSSD